MVYNNVMEVLMFIFDHYDEGKPNLTAKQPEIEDVLEHAGFDDGDINRALIWLDDLVLLCDDADDVPLTHVPGVRVASPEEQQFLSLECQSFLIQLEQLGILDDYSRELVIDRAMALANGAVSLDSLNWVVQMVLYNLPGREYAYACMEELTSETHWH